MTGAPGRSASRGRRAPEREAGPPLALLPWSVADGASNMALDEAMLECARDSVSLVRLYGWDPPCLSLGRHQAAPRRWGGRDRSELVPGTDVVRRPTGGRSVFHGPEVTYAFACPDRAWGGPKAVYRRIHRAIASGLGRLGVHLDREPEAGSGAAAARLAPSGAACFRDPAPGEVLARGRKLVGSAQRRRRGALLQHGSILLRNHQDLGDIDRSHGSAGRESREDAIEVDDGAPVRHGIGLDELLGGQPDPTEVARAVGAAFLREFDGERVGEGPAASALVADVARDARRLEAAYREPARLWREGA
ncbi:MAG: hypothetical protein R3266_00240 [Gemmatimonadota bacterium]|nr:hypothetical protein [Gemmatimonadota bacterium]